MAVRSKGAARSPLRRTQIVEAALRYVDEHGLEALSMHKLGAELGVRGMSLYGHVADKDALLDGIVELMWEEVQLSPPAEAGWQETMGALARSLREVALRHPNAAPLLMSRPSFPEPALRISDRFLRSLKDGGVPESWGVPLLRTIMSYGLGFALAEQSFLPGPPSTGEDEVRRFRRISSLVPRDLDDDLLRVALMICGDCNLADEFELGVALMMRGLEAQLADQPTGG